MVLINVGVRGRQVGPGPFREPVEGGRRGSGPGLLRGLWLSGRQAPAGCGRGRWWPLPAPNRGVLLGPALAPGPLARTRLLQVLFTGVRDG
jgi:hypothetical protein